MASDPILKIAVDTPVGTLFDYLPPADGDPASIQPGIRLKIPFGRRQLVGVLANIVQEPAIAVDRLRRASELLDKIPVLDAPLLELLQWAANYYHHPPGEVIAAALPKGLRQGRPQTETDTIWYATESGRAQDLNALSRRAARQASLLNYLKQNKKGVCTNEILDTLGQCRTQLLTLEKKGWIEHRVTEREAHPSVRTESVRGPEPTPEQQAVISACREAANRFEPILLNGVTGSGKTEVYLRVIEQVLADEKQALVLVPEIGLTPQLVDRFSQRLSVPLAVLHSGLSDGERLNAWRAARSGQAPVVIGTRSAVFAPLTNPGVIVVDEEHDGSYKQQEGFRYHARDLAVRRAQKAGCPVILGSATPSLESLHNAAAGRYHRFDLPERPGQAVHPSLRVVDLRSHAVDGGLSTPLVLAIQKHLDAEGQILLFLNRRGFARVLFCSACGWSAMCERCDARMILHRARNILSCHHCGREQAPVESCRECSSPLHALGEGTERIEDTLERKFPGVEIARIDRDSTRRKGAAAELFEKVRSGQIRILIGTQMLTKGHHFPDVSLVGVLNADQGLFGIDFRSDEKLSQTIVQVAGRAGRAERPGEVIVQTSYPDHPLLEQLIRQGYDGFAVAALAERRQSGWPPFSHLAMIRSESTQRDLGHELLSRIRQLAAKYGSADVLVLGPAAAPMERRAGRYRAQLLFQARERGPLHVLLQKLVPAIPDFPGARRVRWSVDVDPVELF